MATIIDWIRELTRARLTATETKRSLSPKPSEYRGSRDFWAQRYVMGGTSGPGSYGRLARFKADTINEFVRERHVESVIEFGCGDGSQLRLAKYPSYIGFDISPEVLARCRQIFARDHSKEFQLLDDYAGEQAQLTLSLDVIFHLVEDEIFYDHMQKLFDASTSYVGIYSSNYEGEYPAPPRPVRHRQFTRWIEAARPEWQLIRHLPNKYPYKTDPYTESFSDFYFYAKMPVTHGH